MATHATLSREIALAHGQQLVGEIRALLAKAKAQHLTERSGSATLDLGGEGSGNFGHAGRPGEVGGSAPGDGGAQADRPPSRIAYRPTPTPEAFIEARNKSTRPGFLSPLAPEDLKGQKLYLSKDGTVGGAMSADGDMGNLFNNDGPPGAAREVLIDMLHDGGKTADAYDGYLPSLYANFGLQETGRMKFNPEYAPPGWNFAKHDHPDVIFLARTREAAEKAGNVNVIRRRLADTSESHRTWLGRERTSRYYDDYDHGKRDATAAADTRRATPLRLLNADERDGVDGEARPVRAGRSESPGRGLTYRDRLVFDLGGEGSGDVEGHPFRGNQWTGDGGGEKIAESAAGGSLADMKRADRAFAHTAMGVHHGNILDAGIVERTAMKKAIVHDTAERLLAQPGTEHLTQHEARTLMTKVVDQWAESSGDHQPLSVKLQQLAVEEFGVTGAAVDHLGKRPWSEQPDAVLRGTLRAQYEATQAYFKAQGITHLTLARGTTEGRAVTNDAKVAETVTLRLQPLSSWSTSLQVARSFSGYYDDDTAKLLVTRVPVERVVSTAVTGVGCLREAEVVVLGGPLTASAYQLTRYGGEDELAKVVSDLAHP